MTRRRGDAETRREQTLTREEMLRWLCETDEARLGELWREANNVRKAAVGDAVHLRGLIEISNYCIRQCGYCGLNAKHTSLERYRMSEDEIIACAHQALSFGYGTVVIQAGEDYGLTTEFMSRVVKRIKSETPLAVTLSLGERPDSDLAAWRRAGADRYLLRFETSDTKLYELIHPSLPGRRLDRFAILRTLKDLGYEVGSGVMVGIPGQSYETLASDIEAFAQFDLDMIGIGPYISHPATPLVEMAASLTLPDNEQVPNTELMVYKVVALARMMCPLANIPSTTALATINRTTGRELGLARGANVVMPNVTPVAYRELYEIYPAKACIAETADACRTCLRARIEALGRTVGQGPGSSPKHLTVH